jgi:hypothetical protein
MDLPPILSRENTTTLTRAGIVFDPARDLLPQFQAPSSDWVNALESVAPTIIQKIEEQSAAGETWVGTLQKLMPALAMTWQQREIMQIQLERARQGLPPLPNSEFGAQAKVSIGLDPQMQRALIAGGAVLIGLIAWRMLRKG